MGGSTACAFSRTAPESDIVTTRRAHPTSLSEVSRPARGAPRGRLRLGPAHLCDVLPPTAYDKPASAYDEEFPLCSRPASAVLHRNMILRDPHWRRRDAAGALQVSAEDATRLGSRTASPPA